jgi:hypothetical protein
MTQVFEVGGDLVREETAQGLMRLIAEVPETGGDDDIRVYAVDAYVGLLAKQELPDVLVRVIAWVLGEYGHRSKTLSIEQLIELLCEVVERQFADDCVRGWALEAIQKLEAQMTSDMPTESSQEVISRYQTSRHVDLQQRAHEFLELLGNKDTMRAVLPPASFAQEFDPDAELSFLDGYVAQALAAGASPYQDPADDDVDHGIGGAAAAAKGTLAFEAYDSPEANPYANESFAAPGDDGGAGISNPMAEGASDAATPTTKIKLEGVARKWGPSGFNGKSEAEKEAEVAAEAAQAAAEAQAAFQTNGGGGGGGGGIDSAADIYGRAAAPASQSAPAPVVKAPVVKELTEREKMAAALFGGVATSGGGGGGGLFATPAAAAPVAAAPSGGLFSGMQTSPTRAAPTPQPVAAAPMLDVDIFGGGGGGVATPVVAPSSSGGDLLDMDIFGSAPAASPAANNGGGGGGGDLLDIFGGASVSGGSVGGGGGGPRGAANMSARMKGRLQALSKTAETTVVDDAAAGVHVSSYVAHNPSNTLLCLFITNTGGAPLAPLHLQFQPPAGVGLMFDGEPAPQRTPGVANAISVNAVNVGQTVVQLVDVKAKDTTAGGAFVGGAGDTCIVNAAVTLPSGQTLQVAVPLNVRELLRPCVYTTAEYGAGWKAFSKETKIAVSSSSVTTPTQFMELMKTHMHVHPVQIIRNEMIAAGKVLSGSANANMVVLIHGKFVTGGGVAVTVRSAHAGLGASVSATLKAVLS